MAEGKIKRLTDKGFGFIETGTDKDMFFHTSIVEGARFEDLREGQRVSYTPGQGPKGPRAENVCSSSCLRRVTYPECTRNVRLRVRRPQLSARAISRRMHFSIFNSA